MDNTKYSHINTEIGFSPVKFNVAIVSINSRGSLGELNLFVLNELGYDSSKYDLIDVSKGYYLLQNKINKPILFIVTVGDGEYPGTKLHKNLTKALNSHHSFLESKKVWVPLMGTGAGGLGFVTSYETTVEVLKEFKNINFTISIPEGSRGRQFIKEFKSYKLQPENEPRPKVEETVDDHLKGISDLNVFLVGSVWGGEDQMERFIDQSIWENGYDDKYLDIVNSVRAGDFLLIKSTYATKGDSILRIKASGYVVENDLDEKRLHVKWAQLQRHFDISGLGFYRNTIVVPSEQDKITIIDHLLKNISPFTLDTIKNNISKKSDKENVPSNAEIKNITTIAGLLSDADAGTDYLEISKDVNAFAKVMSAKSFKPPLAIALLGKWGSGKSFFMRKLKERIDALSKSEHQKAYCTGIAHVHFNAWSYMDANLWAGIIIKIFEGLKEYITNNTLASVKIEDVEKQLTKKLNIAHDEITDLEHQKESIDKKIDTLESQKGKAEENLKSKIDEIKNKSIKKVIDQLDESFKISDKVQEALASNNSFNKSIDKFGEIVPREYWQNPTALYEKVKSKYTFIKTFFKGASWKDNLAWVSLIIILIVVMKVIMFFVISVLGNMDFTIPTKAWYFITIVGGFIYRNYQTLKRLQPLISSFWKIKEDYESKKEEVIFQANQAEKALKYEIENFKSEIEAFNAQINQAKQSKAEIEYRLENTLTTEALFSFIEKRSVSDDYKKHLGIVSVIRKDFEILSELFSGHNTEYENAQKLEESAKFQEQFSKPLERIILYIDDLDRCSDDRVVQVLEAVNLLMAYPLFVVVVGVDPRWVKNALTKKYKLQFANESELNSSETIEPSGYLEKIFQVPFQLKAATSESVKHMLKTLAESHPETEVKEGNLIYDEDDEVTAYDDGEEERYEINVQDQPPFKPGVTKTETIESLKFSDKEITLLQSMSDVLGTNPRALKRFVNIYRVIKAHEDFNYTNEAAEGELLAVMFLIALPLGAYRKLVKPFEEFINNKDKDKEEGTIISFFSGIEYYELRSELINVLQDSDNGSILIEQQKNVFRKHNAFIKRFTFNNL